MKKLKTSLKSLKFGIVTALFCSYNFTVLAETKTFNTVTEALNYTGNKAAVTKLIITGTISGNDYSESSEWSKFRTLNETFPNIEEVEIFTNQDIPDFDTVNNCALFYWLEYDEFEDDSLHISSNWLKNFSAPNIKYIGKYVFESCSNLTTVNFPLVTIIGSWAFYECINLTSVSLETKFITPHSIRFYSDVFLGVETENIDLILGENVLPLPDLTANTWQTQNGTANGTPYVWKSIKITDGIEEIIKNATVSIFPNPTAENATVSFELETACNVKIVLSNVLGQELIQVYDGFANEGFFIKTINTKHLSKGVYLLKVLIGGNYTVEKIIVN